MDASLGFRLRSQRERQGVTLAAIAEETKINIALLEGLERDDVARWPGGLFRRAYVRAYARAIGLEPEQTVRQFLDRYPDPVEEVDAETIARARSGPGLLRNGVAALRRVPPATSTVTSASATTSDLTPPAPQPQPPSTYLEQDLLSVSRLCTALGSAADLDTVKNLLADANRLLDARGLIVWVWDAVRAVLCPAIAHGYPEAMLRQLATLARNADSAIVSAFHTAQVKVVEGEHHASGAFVTPLLTPAGCVGVLAIEFGNGGEQRQSTRAFATIIGAQLSTLLPTSLLDEATENVRQCG